MHPAIPELIFMQANARKSSLLAVLCCFGLLVTGVAGAAEQETPPKPQLSGLKARVAKGERVDLAASRLTSAELASLRPEYEKLKPRARTNTE